MTQSCRLLVGLLGLAGLTQVGPASFVSALSAPPKAEPASRVQLVPQTTQMRLEDIFEIPGSGRLVTHDRKFAPYLWDPPTGRLLKVLGGNGEPVTSLAIAPDGSALATVAPGEVRVWDLKLGEVRTRISAPTGSVFATAAFSPDATRLAIGLADGVVRVSSTASATPTASLRGATGWINEIAWSPDGKRLAVASQDGSTRLWSVDGKALGASAIPGKPARWVSFAQDGLDCLATSEDGSARLLDGQTARVKQTWPHVFGTKGFLRLTMMGAVFVGPVDAEVVTASPSGDLVVFNRATGQEVRRLKGHSKRLRELRRSTDGRRLATVAEDERLFLWDVATGKHLPFTLPPSENPGIPLLPTAGNFSVDSQAFWLGYYDGSIRRHETSDGTISVEVLRSTAVMMGAWWVPGPQGGRLWVDCAWRMLAHPVHDPKAYAEGGPMQGLPLFSSDQRRVVYRRYATPDVADLYDAQNGGWISGRKDVDGAQFAPDGKTLAVWHTDGVVQLVNADDGESIVGWHFKGDAIPTALAFQPGTELVAHIAARAKNLQIWNMRQGKILQTVALPFTPSALAWSVDGRRVAVVGEQSYALVNAETGAIVVQKTIPNALPSPAIEVMVMPSGDALLVWTDLKVLRINLTKGAVEWSADNARASVGIGAFATTNDRSTVVTRADNRAQLRDAVTGQVRAEAVMQSELTQATISPDGKTLTTVDSTDGVAWWDVRLSASSGQLVPRGRWYTMSNGDWLVMDEAGRYDASDPAKVAGASYVVRWSDGLEPVDVPQLKDRFYEPGLMAKILGTDREARSPVPQLADLRLFPSVELKRKGPLAVDVVLRERDGGGIGRTVVSLNGKQILDRKGVGYFTVDLRPHAAFLLPSAVLPPGKGNRLMVTVANAKGDLTSSAVEIDLGVPDNLKSPDARLFALFVGAGDYGGAQADLIAPPNDAQALANALRRVSEPLLPGRVDITVMTTAASGDRPTRVRLLDWFDRVAKEAKSIDIVFVFFAGHGVNQLGDQRGYFFLTPDADPTNPATLIANRTVVGGEDLRLALAKIPAAKQVVVLDTCASGAVAEQLLAASRGVAADYQRAYESIRDATGTWLLAGAASDQKSYESPVLDHGLLTYALLEAIDRANPDGLRSTPSGDLFVDVERWLTYAAGRVESLRTTVAIKGDQRPVFRRATEGMSFDVGVTRAERRGQLGLKGPKPILLMGSFQRDEEDPAGMEPLIAEALRSASAFIPTFDVARAPNAYRITGTYVLDERTDQVRLKVTLQRLDANQVRRNLESFELTSPQADLPRLAAEVRREAETRILRIESRAVVKPPTGPGEAKG